MVREPDTDETKQKKRATALLIRDAGKRNTILTVEQVQAIKSALAVGERGRILAGLYGVSESAVSKIKQGKRWKEEA